ncbi:chromatin associated protein KTI12 [Cryphonectria parasitica EP155]|uniref:Chromatin associated protein KTI12 n=1 Tax=Cryphonectria parasitica (strain ATCC 38755 / EP155) TaxID=660469 RepID=A0A9P5CT58_CRYP1|nr:chromatin associated protein KTI12 [Cryphonectria parasitica EP155]KAF3769983.1 chromatin associated protein KTI12 [Cryphonectria parasitica EP155]
MPLIIVTGLPTSGKSTRANQLLAYLTERVEAQPQVSKYRLHLISDQTQSISRTVYDLSPEKLPAHTRSANASEKDARAALSSAVKRVLSTKDIVILDGSNYIKGWRYQLYCEAKNLSTPNVLLQVGCSVDRARAINEERLRQRDEKLAGGEDASGDDLAAEGAYDQGNWENLVFRYEEPNPMTRWDSPLFTLIWEDDEAQTRKVFDDLWEAIAGEGRKVVKPNQAAVQRSRDAGGDYLYVLDRETQDIVKSISEQQPDEGGGEIQISRGGDSRGQPLVVEIPSRRVGLPQLQRYRRAFMNMNRGGIGLEAVGNMAVARMRESFVGYLNDAFEKDE